MLGSVSYSGIEILGCADLDERAVGGCRDKGDVVAADAVVGGNGLEHAVDPDIDAGRVGAGGEQDRRAIAAEAVEQAEAAEVDVAAGAGHGAVVDQLDADQAEAVGQGLGDDDVGPVTFLQPDLDVVGDFLADGEVVEVVRVGLAAAGDQGGAGGFQEDVVQREAGSRCIATDGDIDVIVSAEVGGGGRVVAVGIGGVQLESRACPGRAELRDGPGVGRQYTTPIIENGELGHDPAGDGIDQHL